MAPIPNRRYALASNTDSSAAGRVLDVMELLEMILGYLPFFERDLNRTDPVPDDINGVPAYSRFQALFGVQRVNRMFRDTITGSTKLKRLMFLEPLGESFNYSHLPPGDMRWGACIPKHYQRSPLHCLGNLTRRSAGFTEEVYNGSRFASHFTCAPFLGREFEDQELNEEVWVREEASWRNNRIANYKDSGDITIDFLVERELLPIHRHISDMWELKYTDTRVFEPDCTIGDVYDVALEIDCRGLAEHGEAMAGLVHNP